MPLKGLFQKLKTRASSPRPDTGVTDKDRANAKNRFVGSVEAESESHGLHLLSESISSSEADTVYSADVIFVHGLNGHWARTWTHRNGTFWPKDLLPYHLPGARVFSYGYPSRIFANKSVAGLRDFAKHLLDDIRTVRGEGPVPIIYVCHSLGGIVVKQQEFGEIWSSSKAVIFMGTPHRGSSMAAFGKTLGNIANVASHISLTHRLTGGVNTSLIETLGEKSVELSTISADFYLMVQRSALHIISLYETEAHPLTNRPIVEKSSALLGLAVERYFPLYLNHQDLCRFFGSRDTNYIKVSELIKSEASKEPIDAKTAASSLYTNRSYDETEKACASLLNTVDIAGYQAKIDSRVEGTLEWILHESQYNTWASNSDVRLLWVTGYMGYGKTMLASFIWRYLNEQHSRALVCRFFCDEGIEEYHDPCALLRSLIFQIVSKRRRLWRLVKKASDAGGFQIFGQFDALWNLFVHLARSETELPITIIIDAIDELNPGAQRRIANCIFELLSPTNTTSIKFFVTSRLNADSELGFRAYSAHVIHLSLEDNKDKIDSDIRSVIRHRLEHLVNRGVCKPLVRDTLENMLVAKADQTFLWIKLVLPILERRQLIRLSDAEIIVNQLPMTLASLYRHLLTSIHEDDQAMAAKVLRLLVVCDRPLTGDEIGILLSITSDHKSAITLTTENLPLGQESVQSLLGDLVRVHDNRIVLIHQSLRDYLTNLSKGDQDSLAVIYGVDRVRDKIVVFRACSIYLSLEEFWQNICIDLETLDDGDNNQTDTPSRCSTSSYGLSLFNEAIFEDDTVANESTWVIVNTKFKLFDYAAMHWAADFANCDGTITVQDNIAALSLCETGTSKLTNWFRYYWYRTSYSEALPEGVDTPMILSFFGHSSNLLYMLEQPGPMDSDSLSRALYWAARQGQYACVMVLLQQSACNPLNPAIKSQVPLIAAAQFGHIDCVSILLKDPRMDINTQDGSGRTALSLAVSNNHAEIVSALLAHNEIDMNLQDNASNTPLHRAIGTASVSIIARLLNDERADINKVDGRGRNVLSWAAELGATESAALIIRTQRIPVDHKDTAGRTPLSYASQHGHLPVVRKLIEVGKADPLGRDGTGRNAHSWAAMDRRSEVLRYLVKNFPQGADVPDQDGWTPITWAFDPPGYLENMRLLLRYGHINLEQRDSIGGRTILGWTANYGHTEMAAELVKLQGINIDARDANGRTPLSEAAGSGSLAITEMLIDTERVDLNSRDQSSLTPLSWAVRGGHEEVVRLLLTCRAIDLDSQNNSGETALDIARKLGRTEIVLALESWKKGGALIYI